jgi:iron complex transport system substrate-binding protein
MPVLRTALVASLIVLAACSAGSGRGTAALTDDFGDTIIVGSSPKRIVSLNPATTEIAFALGWGRWLVGRTHWDLYPPEAKLVTDLGSGIRPNVEAVIGARPDLVLLYASSDNRPAAARLRAAGIRTLSLKVDRIADFYRAMRLMGLVSGDTATAAAVSDSVARTLTRVRQETAALPKPTVFWHIWDAPLITIGHGSYLDELITIAGGANVYGDMSAPSPTVGIEDVLKRNPQYIIAGAEGAAKIKADPRWSTLAAVKAGRVLVVDTSLVGRPSTRLGEAAVALALLLHPGAVH